MHTLLRNMKCTTYHLLLILVCLPGLHGGTDNSTQPRINIKMDGNSSATTVPSVASTDPRSMTTMFSLPVPGNISTASSPPPIPPHPTDPTSTTAVTPHSDRTTTSPPITTTSATNTTASSVPTIPPANTTIPTTLPTTSASPTPETPKTSRTTDGPLQPTSEPTKDRRFDGPSFIGGIVLSLGIMAIAFVSWKFYKARSERNYHTL